MTQTSLVISARFCGPPTSGNGGYTCGLLARHAAGPVEVTLRRPPPLDAALRLVGEEGRRSLWADADLVAEARPASLSLDVPTPPSFDEATRQAAAYVGHARHHFPTCFVCGPARPPGDGLRIFPGRLQPGVPVAAPFIPDESVAEDGVVPAEIAWAAIDCPGYFGVAAPDYPVALLGRMTGEVVRTLRSSERCVVMGWSLGREGRKLHAGSALFGADGTLVARAQQTWITIASRDAAAVPA